MATADQTGELEQALLDRARALVDEQISHAEDRRERLIQQARERLHQRHEQQQQQLQQLGERHYQQRMQAAELRIQSKLERLRWTLIEAALGELDKKLDRLAEDEGRYSEVLQQWLDEATNALGGDELQLQMNKRDLQRFGDRFARDYRVSDEPLHIRGGLVLLSADGRARYDNSFEGRRERYAEPLYRLLIERLFGSEASLGSQRGR